MSGIHAGQYATDADLLRAQRIFDAGGRSIVIKKDANMDAVTAVSGTGPAYFYYFVEALTEAGKECGLAPQQAELLARQACLGAARMMVESKEPPAELRKKVMSPGGTTEAAMASLADNRVFDAIRQAVQAARSRSEELGH